MQKALLTLCILATMLSLRAFAQNPVGVADSRPIILEIQFFKGMQFAYQRIGGSSMYGAWQTVKDWRPKDGDPIIQGVNMSSRIEDGIVKIRVSLVRGKYFEVTSNVGEYTVTEGGRTVVSGLADFGIVPFEVGIVRAPATVAELPAIDNKTKSLSVTVEAVTANIPSFKVKIANIGAKPVMAYSWYTSLGDRKHLTGMSRNRNATVLIEPGASVERILPYPVKPTTSTTGERPDTRPDLVFNIRAVMFDDGTYEGEASAAAWFRALQVGQQIQIQHILRQLRAKYDSVDAFAAALSQYEFSMDETAYASYAREFPSVSKQEMGQFRELIESEAIEAQKALVKVFSAKRAEFEADPASLQTWKDAEIQLCQRLLNSFPPLN